jgi:MoaA/NifB/PqqE/SkfB family radical SAM enzyme
MLDADNLKPDPPSDTQQGTTIPQRPGARFAGRVNFDTSPLIVFYEITKACDLVCLHCRAGAQATAAPNEI